MECKAYFNYGAPLQQMVIRSPTILSLFPFLIYKSIFFGFHVRVLFPAKSTPKSLLPFNYLLITPTYLVLCAIKFNFVVFKYLGCMQCVCFSFGCYCLYLYQMCHVCVFRNNSNLQKRELFVFTLLSNLYKSTT